MKELITFLECTFLSHPEDDLSWISDQKNKPGTYSCAKKNILGAKLLLGTLVMLQ